MKDVQFEQGVEVIKDDRKNANSHRRDEEELDPKYMVRFLKEVHGGGSRTNMWIYISIMGRWIAKKC